LAKKRNSKAALKVFVKKDGKTIQIKEEEFVEGNYKEVFVRIEGDEMKNVDVSLVLTAES